MSNPYDLGGLLWERDAELAFSLMTDIEKAAEWCRKNGPHKIEFLTQMKKILVAEDVQAAKLGLTAIKIGTVKRTSVLNLLTPSQALRLLECYKRATANSPAIWKAKNIEEIIKIESDQRHDKTIAEIREQLKRRQ